MSSTCIGLLQCHSLCIYYLPLYTLYYKENHLKLLMFWSFGENKKDVELFYSGVNASKLPVNCCWVVDQWAVNGSERERELLCIHAQRNHRLTGNPSDTSTAISVTKWSFRHCHSKLYFFRRYFFSKTWKQMNLMKIIVLKGIASEWRQKMKIMLYVHLKLD